MVLTLRTRDGNLARFPPSFFCFLEAERTEGNENSAGSKGESFYYGWPPPPAAGSFARLRRKFSRGEEVTATEFYRFIPRNWITQNLY